jgi:hypothetical protein
MHTKTGGSDLWVVSLDDPADAHAIIATPNSEQEAHPSPAGRWLAHVAYESDRAEVFVQPIPSGKRVQVSRASGAVRDDAAGRRLPYRTF